nr:amino acid permease [Microbulbifer sediminum]
MPVVSFYGIGTIIGAGIYVLVGKVGGAAGMALPYAFLLAGIIAGFTALSYAELASRFPVSAGSAAYIRAAWQRRWPAQVVGTLVALTGIVSAATIANGFVGYLALFIQIPDALAITLLVVLLTLIALWGINESALTVMLVTLIEVGGLLFVIYASRQAIPANTWGEIIAPPEWGAVPGLLVGSFLAFYAFIGFEDMVNTAEEVKEPRKTLPQAILLAISTSTVLYMMIAALAVRTLPVAELAQSEAPLATMVTSAGYSPTFIGVISLFAVVNGALVQIIMASRLAYGMAKQKMAPRILAHINARTRTPVIATLLIGALILTFALWLPLTALAKITSFIMLLVFCLVNSALLTIKVGGAAREEGVICYPAWIPATGLLSCLGLMSFSAFG